MGAWLRGCSIVLGWCFKIKTSEDRGDPRTREKKRAGGVVVVSTCLHTYKLTTHFPKIGINRPTKCYGMYDSASA